MAQIRKCLKLLRFESVRNWWDWKVSKTAQISKCQKLLKLESVRIRNDEDMGTHMKFQWLGF